MNFCINYTFKVVLLSVVIFHFVYVHVSYVVSSISHDDDQESKDKELVRQGIYLQYDVQAYVKNLHTKVYVETSIFIKGMNLVNNLTLVSSFLK